MTYTDCYASTRFNTEQHESGRLLYGYTKVCYGCIYASVRTTTVCIRTRTYQYGLDVWISYSCLIRGNVCACSKDRNDCYRSTMTTSNGYWIFKVIIKIATDHTNNNGRCRNKNVALPWRSSVISYKGIKLFIDNNVRYYTIDAS